MTQLERRLRKEVIAALARQDRPVDADARRELDAFARAARPAGDRDVIRWRDRFLEKLGPKRDSEHLASSFYIIREQLR